jgi:hypothetical protein
MRALPAFALLAITSVYGCKCDVDPLETPKPHMKVTPEVVVLNGVPVAQDTRIVIQVQNDSIIELNTLNAELDIESSDPAFKLDEDYPRFVLSGQTGEIVVVVRPLVVSTITASLIITGDGHDTPLETDDAQPSPRVVVPITVNAIDAGLPDICDYPDEPLVFGLVGMNDVARLEVPVKNCGVRDLILDEVLYCPSLDDEGATPDPVVAECAVIATDPIRLGTEIEAGTPMAPGSVTSIPLLFRPLDLLEHTGSFVIRSNDPDEPVVVIPVEGEGSACPVAVAELIDDPDSIEPFDTVRLDGRNSMASDSDVPGSFQGRGTYEWTLRQRPQGSTATVFPPDEDGTEIETDLAGRYVVDLHVYETHDNGEVRSCVPSTVTFDVVPTEELLIQLVWDHETADLDLHLVRGGGTEFTHEDDCYFSNREPQQTEEFPDWSAVPEENPVLDVDDDEGYGPENMNIVAPAPGSQWNVLVHYWNQQTDGDARTTATVRVFVYGQQVMEIQRVFEEEEVLWEALDITWALEELAQPTLSQVGVVREYPRPF